MGEFLVERYLPGISAHAVREARIRLQEVIEEMAWEGNELRYLHCTFLPDDESVLCVFLGSSTDVVMEANRRAAFAFDRVVPATEIDCDAGRTEEGPRDDGIVP